MDDQSRKQKQGGTFFPKTRYRFWLIKFLLAKYWVAYSTQAGLFNYQHWFRRNHKPPKNQPKDFPNKFGALIWYPEQNPDLLQKSLTSLKSQRLSFTIKVVSMQSDVESISNENIQHLPDPAHLKDSLLDLAADSELEYVVLCQAGDTFEPYWAYQCAETIWGSDQMPIAVYTDQDQVNPDNQKQSNPFLKPDFTEAMQLSVNLLSNALFKRDWLVGQDLRALNFRDLQDELGFRATEQGEYIYHIPGVLTHTIRPPFPTPADNKRRMTWLKSYLERIALPEPEVRLTEEGHLRATWSPAKPLVSIVILNKNNPMMLEQVLDTLKKQTAYPAYEVIVVDNNSTDPETKTIYGNYQSKPWFQLVRGGDDFNYSAFNNLGAAHAKGEYVLFLNNDIEIVDPNWLDEMVRWASRPKVAVIGAQLLYPNGHLQHAGVVLGLVGSAGHVFNECKPDVKTPFGSPGWYRDTMAVTGACMLSPKIVFNALGGFDTRYKLTFSDVTYCLTAIEQGYRVIYTPAAKLIHHEGGTRGKYMPFPDLQRMYWDLRPWVKKGDPYFNPLLSNLSNTPTPKRPFEEPSESIMDHIQSRIVLG